MPSSELRDHYGRAIEPGSRVAFNYSGYVRLGEVIEVSYGRRYGRPSPIIKVTSDVSRESWVRDPNNLVVLP